MRFMTIDLPRQDYGDKVATLTCYLQDNIPAQAGRLRPAVIICPGGGYHMCSEREGEPVALAFAARGFQAFVLDYTVLDPAEAAQDKTLLPYALRDLAHAVLEVRENAEQWDIDEDRIVLAGFSARGHLAAVYASVAHDWPFALEMGRLGRDLSVSAQILGDPVIDFSCGWPDDDVYAQALTDDAGYAAAQMLVGKDTPRTFIWHTADDGFVSVSNTLVYVEALTSVGVDVDCHIFHHGRHGLSLATDQTGADEEHVDAHVARWLDLALEWLDEG